jgi:hypothetical protein
MGIVKSAIELPLVNIVADGPERDSTPATHQTIRQTSGKYFHLCRIGFEIIAGAGHLSGFFLVAELDWPITD